MAQALQTAAQRAAATRTALPGPPRRWGVRAAAPSRRPPTVASAFRRSRGQRMAAPPPPGRRRRQSITGKLGESWAKSWAKAGRRCRESVIGKLGNWRSRPSCVRASHSCPVAVRVIANMCLSVCLSTPCGHKHALCTTGLGSHGSPSLS
jgi:hypothetical protein